ncbi:hypothetical protein STSP2_01904 [Anaerohalosphaera lusitana]|uniref:Uncharacterized protein n=1 Tax=Anaerohalosphaera lusitana TaxID=1936003 RepID=A0A1U9NLB4_9BACT|nr:hypothetical protein [Anaerohalosphaera lusitana]AQT68732.1 hypothetical protein STSP2_01904 [Anaerohalosphaera lusitana]
MQVIRIDYANPNYMSPNYVPEYLHQAVPVYQQGCYNSAWSVDDIVSSPTTRPSENSEENIFADKQKTSYLALENIVAQIRKRYEIYDSNIRVLEYSKIKLKEHFYQWPQQLGLWPPGHKEMLSEQMNQLYQKQLDEKVSLWKDVSKLKLMLPQSLNDYLSIKRKSDIYSGGVPD